MTLFFTLTEMKFSPTPGDEGDLEAVKHLEFPPLLVHH